MSKTNHLFHAALFAAGGIAAFQAGAQNSGNQPARVHGIEEIRVPAGTPRSNLPPLSGNDLKTAVVQQFREQFDAADTAHSGSITAEQARQSGWGYVVRHFGDIDTTRRGSIQFEEILQFMRSRGSRL